MGAVYDVAVWSRQDGMMPAGNRDKGRCDNCLSEQ